MTGSLVNPLGRDEVVEELRERIDNPEVADEHGGGMCYVDRRLLARVVELLEVDEGEGRELQLWRQVFGPANLAQLEHLAASVHCNCNPVCGHEEEYCAEYDRLAA